MLKARQGGPQKQKWCVLQGECNILKYILGKQQIQQMSLLDEENGSTIFYQLKSLFFDDNQQDEHIVNIIRSDPIKIVGNMLYELTKSYNGKLNQILQPLEQDKYHLLQKLKQTRQRLQHSMDDNQFFKATIDRLEEEKKQTEEKLNQSIDQFERSREEIIYEIHQREKIRSEVMKIYIDAQEIYTQNSQLKQRIAEQEKKLVNLEEQNSKLKLQNEDVLACNHDVTSKYNEILKIRTILLEQIEDLQGRLHERQLFIASFIDEYNKVHLFNQHESLSPQDLFLDRNEYQNHHELLGLNFNNYDERSNISQKSLSKDSSIRNLQSEMDEKFQFVNTAQKLKPKVPVNHPCVTEQKPNKKIESKVSSKQKNVNSKHNKYASNKVQIGKVQSSKKLNKTLVKTVSSKNFQHKQSVMITPSEGDESKMIQQMLKKKLTQKNQKIAKLDSEIASLKDSLIQQREKITIMEGQYELQVEQLKAQLIFTKRQLSKIYEKHTLVNSECQAYRQRLAEIQDEMQAMQQNHATYCQQLKIRCKAYVLKRIDQIQFQYESMKKTINNDSQLTARSRQYDKLQYSLPSQQQLPEECHLQFKEASPKHHQNSCKIDSFSEIQSYQRLSNHYLNSFDLEFSTKLSNIDQNQDQIYIQQKFQIQSNLGMLTQRLIAEKYGADSIKRGNLTDRCNNFSLQIDQGPLSKQRQKILQIVGQIYQQTFEFVINRDLLCFSKQVDQFYAPKQINLQIQSSIFSFLGPQKQPFSLCLFRSYEISLLTKKTRSLSIANKMVNINVQTNKNMKMLKCQAADFINIHKETPKMSLSSEQFTFNQQKIKKYQKYSQTNIQQKSQFCTQAAFDFDSNETQTIFTCPDSECQTQSLSNDACAQTSLQMSDSSTQVSFQYSTSQTQTIIKQQIDNQIQTQIKLYKQDLSQTDSPQHRLQINKCMQIDVTPISQNYNCILFSKIMNQAHVPIVKQMQIVHNIYQISQNKKLNSLRIQSSVSIHQQIRKSLSQYQFYPIEFLHIQKDTSVQAEATKNKPFLHIVRQLDIRQTYNSQIGDQDSAFQLINIPSLNAHNDQCLNSIKSPLANTSTICTPLVSPNSTNFDNFFKNLKNNSQLIHENALYEIEDRSYDKYQNSRKSFYNYSYSHRSLKNKQQNLSTKNDGCVLSKIDNQILSKYLKIEMTGNQLRGEQIQSERRSQQTPHFTEYGIELEHDSLLNNAILLSESCLKDDGKTCNPQSKSYKTQRLNPSQISISPWLVEQSKEKEQAQPQKKMIPKQVSSRLTKEAQQNLLKHLKKHKLSLKFDQVIDSQNFKKPKQLKKKIHFFFVKDDIESEIFMISSNRVHNLKSNLYIKCDKNYRIDDENFIFGQSQVVITGDCRLIINRKDKLNKLSGKLQDGIWQIERYITCSYYIL